MLVDIVVHADLLCAWCYLEKRSLEAAIYRYRASHPDVDFRVVWKPYLLYPTVRKGDKRSLYTNIMSSERLLSFTRGVHAAGTRYGINFAVQGTTGPSQRAHRVVALALARLGPEAQSAVVEAFFRGHFEEGKDLTSDMWLISVGRSVGLLAAEVQDALRSDDMGRTLETEVRAAMAGGVIAVPSVLIGGRYSVGGFQESSLFEGAFERYMRDERQAMLARPTISQSPRLALTRMTTPRLDAALQTTSPSSALASPSLYPPVPMEPVIADPSIDPMLPTIITIADPMKSGRPGNIRTEVYIDEGTDGHTRRKRRKGE